MHSLCAFLVPISRVSRNFGTTGRGENMQIGTYIERSVEHELSGNIIDLCPVGALNSKPFRYQGRSWEMSETPLIAAHDGFGSNLYGHVLRGKLKRVVPRPHDDINETWISDRDRFSYEGLLADDRLTRPLLRKGKDWCEVDWDEALQVAAQELKAAGQALGILVILQAPPRKPLWRLNLRSPSAAPTSIIGYANVISVMPPRMPGSLHSVMP